MITIQSIPTGPVLHWYTLYLYSRFFICCSGAGVRFFSSFPFGGGICHVLVPIQFVGAYMGVNIIAQPLLQSQWYYKLCLCRILLIQLLYRWKIEMIIMIVRYQYDINRQMM